MRARGEILMPVSLTELLDALEFVTADALGENLAFLCKQSGKIYWQSESLR